MKCLFVNLCIKCGQAFTAKFRSAASAIRAGSSQLSDQSEVQDFITTADTLVVYVYSNTNAEYQRNFHFFLEHGIHSNDGHHYIIIVQDVMVTCQLCS